MTESTSETRRLWLRWIVGSAVGGFVFALVVRQVSMGAGDSVWELGPVVAEIVIGAVALGGIMAGIAMNQWLVVRRQVAWAGWLAAGMIGGGIVGGGAAFGVLQGMGGEGGGGMAVAAAVVVGLAVFAGMQWLLLRGRVPEVGRFVWMSVAAVVAAVVATALSGIALGENSGGGVGGAVFGAAYAVVTGFVVIPTAVGRSK